MRSLSVLVCLLIFFKIGAGTSPIEDDLINLAATEGLPSSIVSRSVCAITGAYLDSSVDFVLEGPEKFVFERSYCSFRIPANLCTSWSVNHVDTITQTTMETTDKDHVYLFDIKQSSGSVLKYFHIFKSKHKPSIFSPKLTFPTGLTNTRQIEISGRTNLKNRQVAISLKSTPACHITTGDGEQKFFRSVDSKGKLRMSEYMRKSCNGIQTLYNTADNGTFSELKKVAPDGQVYSWVNGKASDGPNGEKYKTLLTSTGQTINLRFNFLKFKNKDTNEECRLQYLYQVDKTNGPTDYYSYTEKSTPYLYHISSKVRPAGRYLHIEYYKEEKKSSKNTIDNDWLQDRVKSLSAPVGCDSKPIKTHTFVYNAQHVKKICIGGSTEVYDAYAVKTTYHYDQQQRLLVLEKYNKGCKSYATEFFIWGSDAGPDMGNLIGTTLRDENNKFIKAKRLEYDVKGNITIETLFGNLTGSHQGEVIVGSDMLPVYCTGESYSKWFNYSNDGLNLLVYSREPNGKEIYYFYKPGTNLLNIKLEHDKGLIKKRTFCEYDKNGSITQKVIDDGSSNNKDDLINVTERHISRFCLTQMEPIGLPQRTDELYLDLTTGQEILIKRIDACYSIDGKLIKQDVYGSDLVHSYSLFWDYDRHGNLLYHINALGETIKYGYDANDNKISEQDATHLKFFTYDYSNRLIKEETGYWDGIHQISHHKYDYLHNRISTIDPNGCETLYEYDEFCRKTKVTHPAVLNETGQLIHPTESFTYDVLGNVTSHISSRGALTLSKYTIRNQPTLIKYPDGTQEYSEYNGEGTLNFKISKNGTKTQYTYDSFGNVIIEEEFASSGESLRKTTALYSAFHLLSTTDAAGVITNYAYDGAGRLISKTTGDQKTTHEYDSMGRVFKNLEWLSPNEAKVTISLYDKRDRLVEERIEDLQGNCQRKGLYQYDPYDNISRSEEGKSITHYFYDGLNRLIRVIDALGNYTYSVYNNAFINQYGQRVVQQKETDPLGNQTIITKDTHERVVSIVKCDPIGRLISIQDLRYDSDDNQCLTVDHVIIDHEDTRQIITRKEYALGGQLVTQIEAEGTPEQKITRYVYNKSGELEKLIKSSGVILTHTYDRLGRLYQFRSSDSTIDYEYAYNQNDLVIRAADKVHQMHTLCEYDEQGQLIVETLGHGVSMHYKYDAFGRVTALKVNEDEIVYEYDALALKGVSWKENRHEVLSRNLKGQPTAENLINGTTKTYTYDLLDRCIEIEHPSVKQVATYDAIGNMIKTEVNQESKTFSYDALSQLTNEKNNSYDYDSLGNRRKYNENIHQYNALNQIVEKAYSYDENGNLITSEGCTYQYDALDRLIGVTTPSKTIKYFYDAFDRRLIRKVDAQEQHFLYQEQEEIGSLQNGLWKDFRVLGECNQAIAIEQEGNIFVPLYDFTNNVICLMDQQGAITEQYNYSAFKEESSSATLNPWRYANKRTDPETGFVYFGKRYYSPTLGRWVTADPLGYADGPNLYAYVHNNPLRYFDSQGLFGQDFSYNPLKNHYFMGSMQAFGGLVETGIGGAMTLGTGGMAAPIGWAVMAHGVDQFATGMRTVFNGAPASSFTSQALQYAGISPQASHMVDGGLSMLGTMGGTAALKYGQAACNLGPKMLGSYAGEIGLNEKITTDFIFREVNIGGKVSTGWVDLRSTIDRIKNGISFSHKNDGSTFKNLEGLLPIKSQNYYREFVHPTPGIKGAGPQRIIRGNSGELFYTPDHYQTFTKVN